MLSGAGGGGSTTLELSHNINCSLASTSVYTSRLAMLHRYFSTSVPIVLMVGRDAVDVLFSNAAEKISAGSPAHFGVSR